MTGCAFCMGVLWEGTSWSYCSTCGCEFSTMPFYAMAYREDGSHWIKVPKGCLLVREKFTEEIK